MRRIQIASPSGAKLAGAAFVFMEFRVFGGAFESTGRLFWFTVKGVNNMKTINDMTFGSERALYGENCLILTGCRFEGEEDGESACKECSDVTARECFFDLRYPFWHNRGLKIANCQMTENCRAAVWYSHNIEITNSKLHGIKALRECGNVKMSGCDIVSPEFGWSVSGMEMTDCTAESEYFMLRSGMLTFKNVVFKGKYSFQYIENSTFEDCVFNTKDAFWHAKNVTLKNCVVNGEYLAWYSENVTFDRCRIVGTQPLCYCKGLRLVECEMIDTDLAFEKSDVEACVTTPMISVKNPLSGHICVPSVGEIIRDDENSRGEVIICKNSCCA